MLKDNNVEDNIPDIVKRSIKRLARLIYRLRRIEELVPQFFNEENISDLRKSLFLNLDFSFVKDKNHFGGANQVQVKVNSNFVNLPDEKDFIIFWTFARPIIQDIGDNLMITDALKDLKTFLSYNGENLEKLKNETKIIENYYNNKIEKMLLRKGEDKLSKNNFVVRSEDLVTAWLYGDISHQDQEKIDRISGIKKVIWIQYRYYEAIYLLLNTAELLARVMRIVKQHTHNKLDIWDYPVKADGEFNVMFSQAEKLKNKIDPNEDVAFYDVIKNNGVIIIGPITNNLFDEDKYEKSTSFWFDYKKFPRALELLENESNKASENL